MADQAAKPTQVRSLSGFGVAGVLNADAEVFYQSLFSTRHAGRVSDLLAARLESSGADELKLRAVLLMAVFEGHRALAGRDRSLEPILIECGIDSERIAVGVTFPGDDQSGVQVEGLADRIRAGTSEGELEELMAGMWPYVDRMILRYSRRHSRFELISVIGLSQGERNAEKQFELVIFDEPEETPEVAVYVQLGDLDFPELLREKARTVEDGEGSIEDRSLQSALNTRPGEHDSETRVSSTADEETAFAVAGLFEEDEPGVVLSGADEDIETESRMVRGGEKESESLVRVGGGSPVDDELITVSGGEAEAELTRRVGGSTEEKEDAFLRVLGGGPDSTGQRNQVRIQELERLLPVSEETELDSFEPETLGEKVSGFFKKIWPFKSALEEEQRITRGGAATSGRSTLERIEDGDEDGLLGRASGAEEAGSQDDESDEERGPVEDAGSAATHLMEEVESGRFSQVVGSAQKRLARIREEIESRQSKKWIEQLSDDLLSERARLAEMAKKLNRAVKVKEREFKSREATYKEELRRREEALKQKESALTHAKDQVAQMNINMERLKATTQQVVNDAQYKRKFELLKKVATTTKEENLALTRKLEELKRKVNAVQKPGAAPDSSAQVVEIKSLKAKNERVSRQLEEFKRANKALIDRINDIEKKRKGDNAGFDQSKLRLEQAMKLASSKSKEADYFKGRASELEEQSKKLTEQVERLEALVKSSVTRGLGGGGKSGSAA